MENLRLDDRFCIAFTTELQWSGREHTSSASSGSMSSTGDGSFSSNFMMQNSSAMQQQAATAHRLAMGRASQTSTIHVRSNCIKAKSILHNVCCQMVVMGSAIDLGGPTTLHAGIGLVVSRSLMVASCDFASTLSSNIQCKRSCLLDTPPACCRCCREVMHGSRWHPADISGIMESSGLRCCLSWR